MILKFVKRTWEKDKENRQLKHTYTYSVAKHFCACHIPEVFKIPLLKVIY